MTRLTDIAAADEAADREHTALYARVAQVLEADTPTCNFDEAVRIAHSMGRGEGARAARAQLKNAIDGIFLARLAECSSARPDEAPLLRELHAALSTLFTG